MGGMQQLSTSTIGCVSVYSHSLTLLYCTLVFWTQATNHIYYIHIMKSSLNMRRGWRRLMQVLMLLMETVLLVATICVNADYATSLKMEEEQSEDDDYHVPQHPGLGYHGATPSWTYAFKVSSWDLLLRIITLNPNYKLEISLLISLRYKFTHKIAFQILLCGDLNVVICTMNNL